ncbi:MAG: hypothetical protein L0Y72_00595 [Gemmataceae bacterium]|nr:hypothetical protein [Gemmataceae bacterium]
MRLLGIFAAIVIFASVSTFDANGTSPSPRANAAAERRTAADEVEFTSCPLLRRGLFGRRLRWAPTVCPPISTGVDLRFRPTKEVPVFVEATSKHTQYMKVMGQGISQTNDQLYLFETRPMDELQTGERILSWRIIGLKLSLDIGGNQIAYDSTNANAPTVLSDFFKELKGLEFRTHHRPDGTIGKIEIDRETWMKRPLAVQVEPLRHLMNEEYLRPFLEPGFMLPNRTVRAGDSWTRSSTVDAGHLGKSSLEQRFTYRGGDKELHRIDIGTILVHTTPKARDGLPFAVIKSDVKSTDSSGTAWFDAALGRIARYETRLRLAGSIVVDVGGQQTTVELEEWRYVTLRTYGRNPWQKKEGDGKESPRSPPR